MRHVDKDNITDTFISYFGAETSPRTRELMSSLARHLHDFVRETGLTHAEWQAALQFLERTGDITTPQRNEFVLLSDVLGLSSLVDMINSSENGTSSSVLGPFHLRGAPEIQMGADLKGEHPGEVVLVSGQVRSSTGDIIAGAELDVWQTAPNGLYSSQDAEQAEFSFHGLIRADSEGWFSFTTVRPVPYTVPTDGPVGDILGSTGRHPWRPSHLHFIVTAEGYRQLVTEVFPDDDPYLDEDTVFGVRTDLVTNYLQQPVGTFPDTGFALSGKVDGEWSRLDFDFVLIPE